MYFIRRKISTPNELDLVVIYFANFNLYDIINWEVNMKKFLLLITIVGCLFLTNVKAEELPEITDHEKVTIYLFRGHGCSHCYDGLVYLYSNLYKYSDYIDLKAYEVWYNKDNSSLMSAVAEAGGVPFFVIGDSYYTAGFSSKTGEELIATALKEYQNKKYSDLVAKVVKDKKIDATSETLEQAANEEGIESIEAAQNALQPSETAKQKGKNDTIIIISIFVVIIGGILALVLSNRKNA